jgi:hypothetical protein
MMLPESRGFDFVKFLTYVTLQKKKPGLKVILLYQLLS